MPDALNPVAAMKHDLLFVNLLMLLSHSVTRFRAPSGLQRRQTEPQMPRLSTFSYCGWTGTPCLAFTALLVM